MNTYNYGQNNYVCVLLFSSNSLEKNKIQSLVYYNYLALI